MPNDSLKKYWSGYRMAFSMALRAFNNARTAGDMELLSIKDDMIIRGYESGLDAVENTLLRVIKRSKRRE